MRTIKKVPTPLTNCERLIVSIWDVVESITGEFFDAEETVDEANANIAALITDYVRCD